MRFVGLTAILAAAILFVLVGAFQQPPAQATPSGLSVSGNHLVDASGNVVQLRGVNRSGTEYACIQGWGFFDGDNVLSDDSQVPLMQKWGVNEVNLGLNEDCWLDINGVPAAYGGQNYINAIVHETQTLESYGIYPAISLFWSAPGSTKATDQAAMVDNDHGPALWQSVANTFKNDPHVILRLKEEPYPAGNTDGAAAWQCWRNGDVQYDTSNSLVPVSRVTNCSEGYATVGMQSLINIVRGTGAPNVIQAPGVQYANSMTHFLDSAYRVSDTLNPPQLMAAVDVYPTGNICGSTTCYQNEYAPVMAAMPFIAGEFGESVDGSNCGTTGVDALMGFFDQHGAGYSGWAWDTWGGCLQLITDYTTGNPKGNWGNDYKAHLLSLAGSSPTSTATPAQTATPTATLAPATSTPTATPTAVPPTATPTSTSTVSADTPTATAAPSTATPTSTPSTPTSTATPTSTLPAGSTALVQAHTSAGTRSTFTSNVTAGDTLIAAIAVGGGAGCTVTNVTDSLGNTWTPAVRELTEYPDDVEIWIASASVSGTDTVRAAISTGYSATNVTVAEFTGALALDTTAGGGGSLTTTQTTATSVVKAGDLVVAAYSDGGSHTPISIDDGSTQLGSVIQQTVQEESDQSYRLNVDGGSYTATFRTSKAVRAAVAFAAFTPV